MSPASARSRSTTWFIVYLVLAALGLVGTWYFNIAYFSSPEPENGGNYVAAWFANPASSSAAVDVTVTAIASCIFYVRESIRLQWRWGWLLIPATFAIALAFTLPLYLAFRERTLAKRTLDIAPLPRESRTD